MHVRMDMPGPDVENIRSSDRPLERVALSRNDG
jgi:hypothetical protein